MTDRPFGSVRGILETPILDDHKWSKVAAAHADVVLLDLEDSVPVHRKEEARDRVLAQLARPDMLGGKIPLPRVNSLDTPFGEADLVALAGAGAGMIAYPKVRSVRELDRVRRVLRGAGADPWLVPVIESARGVLELEGIAGFPGIAALILGPYDLAVDAGFTPFHGPGLFADAYHYAKSKLVFAGAAHHVPVYDTVLTEHLPDFAQARELAGHARRMGFTGMLTYYAPYLDVINTAFAPSAPEIARAREVVQAYERALHDGAAAARLGDRALLPQDYTLALRTLNARR